MKKPSAAIPVKKAMPSRPGASQTACVLLMRAPLYASIVARFPHKINSGHTKSAGQAARRSNLPKKPLSARECRNPLELLIVPSSGCGTIFAIENLVFQSENRSDCRKTFGELEKTESLSSFPIMPGDVYSEYGTTFCGGKSYFQIKNRKEQQDDGDSLFRPAACQNFLDRLSENRFIAVFAPGKLKDFSKSRRGELASPSTTKSLLTD